MALQKNKLFYIERTEFSIRAARLAPNGEGTVVEEVREISSGAPDEVKAFVQEIAGSKPGQMVRAACAVYPERRILRHCSLKDAAKPSDPRVLEEAVTSQIKINPADFVLAALNADDGSSFDGLRSNRDVVVCGAPRAELKEAQEYLLQCGIYPQRMELGSVAAIGLFLQQIKALEIDAPVLLLEITSDSSQVVILNKGRVDSARPLSLGLNSMVAGVREELGLKDEGAARRLFFSDSFDFREMGPRLIDRLLRELQSMIGFYEVQTGQSIGWMSCTLLPSKLAWLNDTFSSSLGMKKMNTDFAAVLAGSRLAAAAPSMNEISHGLLGLMVNQEGAR